MASSEKKRKKELISIPPCTDEQMKSVYEPLSEERRTLLLKEIEDLFLEIIRQLSMGNKIELEVPVRTVWADEASAQQLTKIRFSVQASRKKFAVIIMILSRVHKNLSTGSSNTRRQLYYEEVSWLRSQREVDDAASCVSRMLKQPPWHLGLLATAKGLIAGNLKFNTQDGDVIDCSCKPGGEQVPADVTSIKSLKSDARMILVVEKDTIFQRLLDEEAPIRLGPCIIVTGKGYPDISTRALLARLKIELKVPIYALMDADPHGFHIMCVYRFGTQNVPLALSSMRWLGMLPTELAGLGVKGIPLTPHDIKRAKELVNKPYTHSWDGLRHQLETMLATGVKAELDALTMFSRSYLTDVYLPSKIAVGGVI